MKKTAQVVKHELQEAIVPTIFFFISFHIVAVTKALMLKGYGVTPTGVAVATVGALTVAKAALIADKLPFLNRLSGLPLVFTVLWKTAIYAVLVLVFRCIEELVPLLSKYGGLGAIDHFVSEVSWPHFWALQIWLIVALILYNTVSELDRHFGEGSVRKALLGTPAVKR